MSDLLLGGMLPRRWHWQPPEWIVEEIFLNWLDIEVDPRIEFQLPTLWVLYGHRRREAVSFMVGDRYRRDMVTTRAIYGYPGAVV